MYDTTAYTLSPDTRSTVGRERGSANARCYVELSLPTHYSKVLTKRTTRNENTRAFARWLNSSETR